MSPPMRQSVARISEELGIYVITLYKWRKTWRLEGEVMPASEKKPEGWNTSDKFTVVLETAGLNATELSAYCGQKGLYPEQVHRWRQAAQGWRGGGLGRGKCGSRDVDTMPQQGLLGQTSNGHYPVHPQPPEIAA